ncbi:target of Sbf, variant 2 [Orbilia brochopaga]|uniref:glucan endo-1,3-beta-D-glucosidase n=1 Tax=Orbilia brochopaga TaxID=3140254 RepID=A0AAV9U8R9_9PEZI
MPLTKAVFLSAMLAFGQFADASFSSINGGKGKEVTVMQYPKVGCSGSYQNPRFGPDSGKTCKVTYETVKYSGPLAPLNRQITFHLRGPIQLHNFAAYYPGGAPSRVRRDLPHHHRRHAHHHLELEKRDPKKKKVKATPSAGSFKKVAFYDANKQKATGLTFMNNKGADSLSGTWSTCFGNSESFMASDGRCASKAPQTLAKGVVFGVDEEFSIWTDTPCDKDEINYSGNACRKGWEGDNKVFVFKFAMPYNTTGTNNNNMPAVWSLNSDIGRSLQYPSDPKNSCWSQGCGEFDIWEVLDSGDEFKDCMTSHLHSFQGSADKGAPNAKGGGGTGDYFKRPATGTFTGMVSYLNDGSITIQKLDDNFDFPDYLTMDQIKKKITPNCPKANVYQ